MLATSHQELGQHRNIEHNISLILIETEATDKSTPPTRIDRSIIGILWIMEYFVFFKGYADATEQKKTAKFDQRAYPTKLQDVARRSHISDQCNPQFFFCSIEHYIRLLSITYCKQP